MPAWGGKAAVELGKRLARLARNAQVIVVTHLAQVASWADAQFVVSKESQGAGARRLALQPPSWKYVTINVFMKSPACFPAANPKRRLDHARELLKDSTL